MLSLRNMEHGMRGGGGRPELWPLSVSRGYGARMAISGTTQSPMKTGPSLVVCAVDLEIGHSPVSLQIVQLRVPLSMQSRPAPEVRDDVHRAFDLAAQERCTAGVTVFPEISVPATSVVDAAQFPPRDWPSPHLGTRGRVLVAIRSQQSARGQSTTTFTSRRGRSRRSSSHPATW